MVIRLSPKARATPRMPTLSPWLKRAGGEDRGARAADHEDGGTDALREHDSCGLVHESPY